MKLITKITVFYLFFTLLVFAAGGIITYNIFRKTIAFEQRLYLKERLGEIVQALENNTATFQQLKTKKVRIQKINTSATLTPHFTDTLIVHSSTKRLERFSQLKTIQEINGDFYAISIVDLIIEPDDIVDSVSGALLIIFGILMAVIILIAYLFSATLFRPFQRTLTAIGQFDVQNKNPFVLSNTNTKEFKMLNKFVGQMMEKAQQDYQNLKEFTENASHELQTPISIASGKLELLQNSPNLKDNELLLTLSAQRALTKLSKLNKSLTLLTKIENKEFSNLTTLNLSEKLKQSVVDFEELINMKHLALKQKIEEGVQLQVDPDLADIVLNNLWQNAVRHNVSEGYIQITLTRKFLKMENTGNPFDGDPNTLFTRFKKDNQSLDSNGLGLSIVKKICDVNHFQVTYEIVKNLHSICITF